MLSYLSNGRKKAWLVVSVPRVICEAKMFGCFRVIQNGNIVLVAKISYVFWGMPDIHDLFW